MLPADPLFHKPKSIIAAMKIMYASLFLAVINWAITQWATGIYRTGPVPMTITLVFTLLIIFLLIKQIGLAKKWARVVLLVLFIGGMLLFPWTIPAIFRANLLVGVISLLQAILQLVALVFLFSRESTQWFNRAHLTALDEPAPRSKG